MRRALITILAAVAISSAAWAATPERPIAAERHAGGGCVTAECPPTMLAAGECTEGETVEVCNSVEVSVWLPGSTATEICAGRRWTAIECQPIYETLGICAPGSSELDPVPKLPTTTCDQAAVDEGHCREIQKGATIPDPAACLPFLALHLANLSRPNLQAQRRSGWRRIVDEAKGLDRAPGSGRQ